MTALVTLASLLLTVSAAPHACPPRRLEVPLVGMNLAEDDEGSGFGSRAALQTLERVAAVGGNAVALVVTARLPDLESNRIYQYVAPSREALVRLVAQAHRAEQRVIVVPHLWVDGGLWRGELRRQGAQADAFFAAYQSYLSALAEDVEAACADALSIGVELKALTADGQHDARFAQLIRAVRSRFGGLLTYSANWDEAEQVRFWDRLDLIAVNGFFPLTDARRPNAGQLKAGAARMMQRLDTLATDHARPVLLIEVGYKATTDNAREPWQWPGDRPVPVDVEAQARAYHAVAAALRQTPRVVGALFWLVPTGTDDPNGRRFEPAWGFNPLDRPAEGELRDLARWASKQRRIGRVVVAPGPEAPQRRP